MTRKQRRGVFIAVVGSVLCLSVGLVLYALSSKITLFYTPTTLAEQGVEPGTRFRLGGLVKEGSVRRGDGLLIEFTVTDSLSDLPVTFTGALPDLFREGQGVVTEGILLASGIFEADTVLARHDENYMPREVAETMKEIGVWKGDDEGTGY